jgi:hypothetical protein
LDKNDTIPPPEHQTQHKHQSKSSREYLKANAFSLFAILISVTSAFFTISNYHDSMTQNTIQTMFRTWMDVDQLGIERWRMTHLYTSPESYEMVKTTVHKAMQPMDEKSIAEFHLKERMFAEYLFDHFDMVCYLYKEALESGNSSQKEYLRETIAYLTETELRNPRMLYLWSANGGKLCDEYSGFTMQTYNNDVLNDKEHPLQQIPDAIGPYYIDSVIAQ